MLLPVGVCSLSSTYLLVKSHHLVFMVAAPLTVHAERDDHNYLREDNTESDVEEVQAVCQRL